MELFCTHCFSKTHSIGTCPNRPKPSAGTPRVVTDTSLLTRKVEDKPLPRRRPLVRSASPPGPIPPQPKNETSPQRSVTTITPSRDELQMSRDALEVECTRLRNKIAALEGELKDALSRAAKPRLDAAERQRRARARKAAKAHVRSGTDGADPAP